MLLRPAGPLDLKRVEDDGATFGPNRIYSWAVLALPGVKKYQVEFLESIAGSSRHAWWRREDGSTGRSYSTQLETFFTFPSTRIRVSSRGTCSRVV